MPVLLAAVLADIWVPVMLLLLVWAIIVFRNALAQLVENVPAVGHDLAKAIWDAGGSVAAWAMEWANTAVGPLVQLVWVPVRGLETMVNAIANAVTLATIIIVQLPDILAATITWATAELQKLIARAADLAARIANLRADVPDIVRAIARALIAVAVDALADAIGAVRSWAQARLHDLAVALAAAVAAVGTLTQVQLPDITGQLRKLWELVGALTAANLIGRVLTLERTLTDTITRCVRPTCSVISPQLPVLTALMDIALLGTVGAVVASAIRDPEGTARTTAGVVGGIADAAEGLATELGGVRL